MRKKEKELAKRKREERRALKILQEYKAFEKSLDVSSGLAAAEDQVERLETRVMDIDACLENLDRIEAKLKRWRKAIAKVWGTPGVNIYLPSRLGKLEARLKRLREATVEVKRLEEAGKREILRAHLPT